MRVLGRIQNITGFRGVRSDFLNMGLCKNTKNAMFFCLVQMLFFYYFTDLMLEKCNFMNRIYSYFTKGGTFPK